MQLPRLYIDQELGIDGNVVLPEKSAHHVLHVLRARIGDQLILFNGRGGEYMANLSDINRDRVEMRVILFDDADRESPLDITLGLGILKRDAMNTAIQKATELGVTSIVPVATANVSVSRTKFEKRYEHWRQVIQSACEQCGRTKLPTLHHVRPFAEWIKTTAGDLKLLASPQASQRFSDIHAIPRSICLLIGPEGGISDEEEISAVQAGFNPVCIGKRILRAETAPAVLLSLVQFRWGDF